MSPLDCPRVRPVTLSPARVLSTVPARTVSLVIVSVPLMVAPPTVVLIAVPLGTACLALLRKLVTCWSLWPVLVVSPVVTSLTWLQTLRLRTPLRTVTWLVPLVRKKRLHRLRTTRLAVPSARSLTLTAPLTTVRALWHPLVSWPR